MRKYNIAAIAAAFILSLSFSNISANAAGSGIASVYNYAGKKTASGEQRQSKGAHCRAQNPSVWNQGSRHQQAQWKVGGRAYQRSRALYSRPRHRRDACRRLSPRLFGPDPGFARDHQLRQPGFKAARKRTLRQTIRFAANARLYRVQRARLTNRIIWPEKASARPALRRSGLLPTGSTISAQFLRPASTQSWLRRRSAMLIATQMPAAPSSRHTASAATLTNMRWDSRLPPLWHAHSVQVRWWVDPAGPIGDSLPCRTSAPSGRRNGSTRALWSL